MKKALYLQILPFHVGAYFSDKSYGGQGPFPESYDHDKSHYYLVVQPMLRLIKTEDGTMLRSGASESPGLVEYLTAAQWNDLEVVVLPQKKIADDVKARARFRSDRSDQLAEMDKTFAKQANRKLHSGGATATAISQLAELGFKHLEAAVTDSRNALSMAPLVSAFKDFAALEMPDYVPVPFPPGTSIQLNYDLGVPGKMAHKQVEIALAPGNLRPAYMALSETQWIDFCDYNHIQREKDVWNQLDADEQTQFRDWAEAVYVDLATARRANGNFDPNPTANAHLKVVWDAYFSVADQFLANKPADDAGPRARWTKWITSTVFGSAKKLKADEFLFVFLRTATNFEKDPSPYWEPTRRLQYPRYFVLGKSLRTWMKALAKDSGVHAAGALHSYHAQFWDGFATEAAKIEKLGATSPGDAAAQELKLATRLAGAIAFGERLRMPLPVNVNNVNLIEIRPTADDVQDPNWIVTCNHSLLGQTPRLGPLRDDQPADRIAFQSLIIKLPGQMGAGVDVFKSQLADIDTKFAGLVDEARSYRVNGASTVKMSLDFDPDYIGRIYFERQMFNVARIKVTPPAASNLSGKDHTLFGAPTALLDAIEATLPFNVSPGDDQVRQIKPRPHLVPLDALSNSMLVEPWDQIAWLARTSVTLRNLSVAAYSERDVFEISIPTDMPPFERRLYSDALVKLQNDSAQRKKVELWREQANGNHSDYDGISFAKECIILGLVSRQDNTGSYNVACQLQLAGTTLMIVKKWLQGVTSSPLAAGQGEVQLQLVLESSLLERRFNLLSAAPAMSPQVEASQLVARSVFNFKPAVGMDGIMERFSLSTSGPVPAPQGRALTANNDKFLSGMLQSFTKARFFMCPSSDLDNQKARRDYWLSYPAAVLPLQEARTAKSSLAKHRPHTRSAAPAYWVVQHFTAPPKASAHHGIGTLALHPEERRYFARVNGAQAKWHLGATIENPFGVRLGASIGKDLLLGYASPVTNLASIEVRTSTENVAARSIPFLRFQVSNLGFGRKRLVLSLDKQALEAGLGAAKALAPNKAQPQADAGPKSLRALYETLCDLQAAAVDGSATHGGARLVFEAWRFDGNAVAAAAPVSQMPEEYQEFPAIVAGLRKIDLGAAGIHALGLQELSPWLQALAPTYDGFVQKLQQMIIAPAADALSITLDMDLATAKNNQQVLFYRAGLEVNRPADAIVHCPIHESGFEVIKPDVKDQIRLLSHSLGGEALAGPDRLGMLSIEACSLIYDDNSSTQKDAQVAYSKLASEVDSPWRYSQQWITPSPAPTLAPVSERLLGEFATKIQLRTLSTEPVPAQRADLYYILYGFVPLPALVSKEINLDATRTFQFAHYIAKILGALVMGEAASLRALVEIAPPADAPAALTLKAAAAAIADTYAERIANFWLDTVHHPVHSTAATAKNLVASFGKDYRDAMRTLLSADPAIYAKAKGIAIGAFKTGAFPDQLAYLQITKRILKLGGTPSVLAAIDDRLNTERFPVMQIQSHSVSGNGRTDSGVHRYFVDVLEDATYGDFFSIAPPLADSVTGATTDFGDALARSAADFLTENNMFAPLGIPPASGRAIELHVRHEEIAWMLGKTKRVYVLPARKPPATPVSVLPEAPGRITTAWQEVYGDAIGGPSNKPLPEAFEQIFFQGTSVRHRHFPSELTIAQEDISMPSTYKRIDALGNAPLHHTKVGAICAPLGWHHVDTSCAHFYFLVDSSEENTIDLDRFELRLTRRPLTSPKPTKTKQSIGLSLLNPVRQLLDWHTYQDAKERTPKPPEVSHDALATGMRGVIDLLWPAPAAPVPFSMEPSETFDIVVTRGKDGWMLGETTIAAQGWSSGLGAVVGVDVLATEDTVRKYLLHFVVLHQPWSSLESALSIKRNWLDLDGDNKPDVNERFVMTTDRSAPVLVDPPMMEIDFHHEKGVCPALGTLTHALDVSHWLNALATAPADPISVVAAYTANFKDLTLRTLNPAMTNDPTLKVWNTKGIANADFQVEARVDYVDRELAPRASSNDKLAIAVVPEREDTKVRQFLTQDGDTKKARSVDASTAETLMYLVPEQVKTPWPNFVITWSYGNRDYAKRTLLQVTIPLRWRK